MTHTRLTALAVLLALSACAVPGAPTDAGTQPAATGLSLKAEASIPVGTAPHGVAYAQGFVYVGNTGSGTISVIDAATGQKVTDLAVGGQPSYTTASPDGKLVANVDTSGKVRLIDPAGGKHTIVQTIEPGTGPDKAVFSADGSKLAVTLTDEPVLPVFTLASGLGQPPEVARFTVGTVAGAAHKHRNMSFKHGYALVPNTGDNNVSLINLASGQTETLTAGNSPHVTALAGSGATLSAVIGNQASNTVTVSRLGGGERRTFAVGASPTDIAVRGDGQVAFITNAGSNDLSVIDVVGMTEITRVKVGKRPVHLYAVPAPLTVQHEGHDEPGEQVWVGNDDETTVTVLDAQSYRVVATVEVGKGHHKMAFSPTKAYVTNITTNDVSVIDRTAVR